MGERERERANIELRGSGGRGDKVIFCEYLNHLRFEWFFGIVWLEVFGLIVAVAMHTGPVPYNFYTIFVGQF